MKKKFYLFIAFIMTIFLSFSLSGCEEKNDTIAKLDDFMSAYNENCTYKYSGTILVSKGDEILLNKGYGMANYEENIPNEPDNVFAIGSISKSFTAVAIMQLQEQQFLNVNDPISKYIEGNERGDDITIHHLLTHTSGLKRNGLMLGPLDVSLENNINFINKELMLFEPGEGSSYSNAGYIILDAIIEKVSGKSYNDYIRDNILNPLKMNNSSLGTDNLYKVNQSIGYEILTDEPKKLSLTNFSCITGCGNIYSTVEDLYKYDRALYHEKLLGKESLDKMFTSYSDSNYGYGWGITERFGHREISHNGHIDGYYSTIIRYPDDDYVLILLSNNGDSTALYQVAGNMSAIVLEKEYIIPQEINTIEVNSEILKKYAGEYEFEEGFSIAINHINDKLYSEQVDGNSYELLPISKTEFYPKNHECSRVKFMMDKNNDVDTVEILSNGEFYEGKK